MWCGTAGAKTAEVITPDTEERARIVRRIKRAEQEGFERHNLKRYLSVFSKKATWSFGRKRDGSQYDYTHTFDTHKSVMARRWAKRPGRKQIHFRWTKWIEEGEARYIDTEVSLLYPGGEKLRLKRYELTEKKGKWTVTSVRSWPVSEHIGPEYVLFDDQAWEKLDTMAERAAIDEGMPFNTRIRHLISAHWIVRAYEVALNESLSQPESAPAWRSRAEIGFTLGKVKQSLKDAKKAFKLDETIPLSDFLLDR